MWLTTARRRRFANNVPRGVRARERDPFFRSGHPYPPIQFLQCSPLQQGLGGPVVVSCGDLPDPRISTDHKHAVVSLR